MFNGIIKQAEGYYRVREPLGRSNRNISISGDHGDLSIDDERDTYANEIVSRILSENPEIKKGLGPKLLSGAAVGGVSGATIGPLVSSYLSKIRPERFGHLGASHGSGYGAIGGGLLGLIAGAIAQSKKVKERMANIGVLDHASFRRDPRFTREALKNYGSDVPKGLIIPSR